MNIELGKYWTKFFAYVALVLFVSQAANIVLIAIADFTLSSNLGATEIFQTYNWIVYFVMTYAIAYVFTKRDWFESLKVTAVVYSIVLIIVYTRVFFIFG